MTEPVLEVRGLRVVFHHPLGLVRAVDDVSFSLAPHERFGLVGESGSGKSTMALAIMRLIRPPGEIETGDIRLGARLLSALSDEDMRRARLAGVAMVPQGSMNALNPVIRIGDQIADAMRDHDALPDRNQIGPAIARLMSSVGLPRDTADKYPHELSGGMKQRVCIAIAICLRPTVIIADEPTSALDVVVQRQVMRTLADAQLSLGAAILLIGHDMGLMAQFVDRLGVMYAGRLVEVAPIAEIVRQPRHPYTALLIASLPSMHEKTALRGIPGLAPMARERPSGCAFHPRCPRAESRCEIETPAAREMGDGVTVACHFA